MSDGYETEELTRIEAALDALVSPTSEDVFQATRPFDERAIASVAAKRASDGGVGGSSPFELLGPYTVTYAQVDPVVYVDLGALDDGTIVWAVNVFVRTEFTHATESINVKVGTLTDLTDDWNAQPSVFGNDKISVEGAYANVHPSSDPVAQAAYTTNGIQATPSPLIAQHGAHLAIANVSGGNSAGSLDLYLFASVTT